MDLMWQKGMDSKTLFLSTSQDGMKNKLILKFSNTVKFEEVEHLGKMKDVVRLYMH